jgi:hypothetical protein
MIFFAVASPTPGNSFSSAALALFRSTIVPVGPAVLDVLAVDFAGAAALLVVGFVAAGATPPNVTSGVIFLMVAAETPAFDKSLTEE